MAEKERMTAWFKMFSMIQVEHVNLTGEKSMKLKKTEYTVEGGA